LIKILSIISVVVQCLVPALGYIGKKKEQAIANTLIDGIERYSRVKDNALLGKELKNMIKTLAIQTGIEDRLNKKINKLFNK